jgi:hypothetical protein
MLRNKQNKAQTIAKSEKQICILHTPNEQSREGFGGQNTPNGKPKIKNPQTQNTQKPENKTISIYTKLNTSIFHKHHASILLNPTVYRLNTEMLSNCLIIPKIQRRKPEPPVHNPATGLQLLFPNIFLCNQCTVDKPLVAHFFRRRRLQWTINQKTSEQPGKEALSALLHRKKMAHQGPIAPC